VKNMDGGKVGRTSTATPPLDGDSGEDVAEGERDRTSRPSSRNSKAPRSAGQEEQEEADEEAEGAEEDDDDVPGSPTHNAGASSGMPESKWSFEQFRNYCDETAQDYDLLMDRIKDLIVKTLLAAEPPIVNMWHQGANYSTSGFASTQLGPNQTCFEVYGFDVMCDDKLKPWLLEVNTFPSISSSSPFDKRVKTMLVADSLTLAGFLPFDADLVEKACKDDHVKRLQGLHQKHMPMVATRSHGINNIASATLKSLGEAEWQLILDTYDEFMRRGQLERIYPTRESVDKYLPLFATPRYSNMVLARWLQEGGERCFTPEARGEVPPWLPKLISSDSC